MIFDLALREFNTSFLKKDTTQVADPCLSDLKSSFIQHYCMLVHALVNLLIEADYVRIADAGLLVVIAYGTLVYALVYLLIEADYVRIAYTGLLVVIAYCTLVYALVNC